MKLTIDDIARATATHYNMTLKTLLSVDHRREVAWPRQLAMVLAREFVGESFPKIGDYFSGRDHTTVIHAVREFRANRYKVPGMLEARQEILSIAKSLAEAREKRRQEAVKALLGGIKYVAPEPKKVGRPPKKKALGERKDQRSWYAKLGPSSISPPSPERLRAGRA